MKKILFFALCSLLLISCKRGDNNSDSAASEDISDIIQRAEASVEEIVGMEEPANGEFKNITYSKLDEALTEDFNGDGVADKAEFVIKNDSVTTIIITDGKTGEKTDLTEIGGDMPDNFEWVDRWAVTKDKQTSEVVIEGSEVVGSRIINLGCPSIVVTQEELGGGVITFSNKVYRWVHQTC